MMVMVMVMMMMKIMNCSHVSPAVLVCSKTIKQYLGMKDFRKAETSKIR